MLTNDQKSLLKRGQKQSGLADSEYREALQLIAAVESSTDPKIGDRHLDKLMAYFEAIYWQKVSAGQADNPDRLVAKGQKRKWLTFLAPGYWANKNTKAETSRDRYVAGSLAQDIATLEKEMADLGFNGAYCNAIRIRVTSGRGGSVELLNYKAALARTVASKQKKLDGQPF